MEQGVLDKIGEQVFTTGKVRKALDKLFMDPPAHLIRIIRSAIGDEAIKPVQVKEAIKRLWAQSSDVEIPVSPAVSEVSIKPEIETGRGRDYGEEYHVKGMPREVIELFRTIDKYCRELDPNTVQRKYLATYISYMHGKVIFCCVHLQKSGLRVWLKLKYSQLENPPEYIRDVSSVGHWGVGDVEIAIDSLEKLQTAKSYIRKSFEENK